MHRLRLLLILLLALAPACSSDLVAPDEVDPPGLDDPDPSDPPVDPCATVPCPDPGTGPWAPVPVALVEDVCRLDPELLQSVNVPAGASFAVVRYGRLCWVSGNGGSDGPVVGAAWSATKTLGAVLTGAVLYATRSLPASSAFATGRLGEFDRMDDWIDLNTLPADAQIHPDATVAHVLAMVGYSQNLAHGQKTHQYDAAGSREINHLVPVLNAALAQSPSLFGANAAQAKDRLFQALGMQHSSWSAQIFGYSWYGSLLDMARVGLLMLRGGVWDGERLLDAEYVYNMTHPAFEDGSTRYGYLTWMNNATCAPRAIHRSFPHGLSGATDCEMGNCDQDHDVGAWSANGLGGQYIMGHRGLDLVIVARNWGGSVNGFWRAVVPAIVAEDPVYQGNEAAFCQAYGANAYAPDLKEWEGGW